MTMVASCRVNTMATLDLQFAVPQMVSVMFVISLKAEHSSGVFILLLSVLKRCCT